MSRRLGTAPDAPRGDLARAEKSGGWKVARQNGSAVGKARFNTWHRSFQSTELGQEVIGPRGLRCHHNGDALEPATPAGSVQRQRDDRDVQARALEALRLVGDKYLRATDRLKRRMK